jgi:hypothetical protein
MDLIGFADGEVAPVAPLGDVVWRHDDGLVVTWEMQDGDYSATDVHGDVATAWQIAGTGEFDLV